MTTLIVIALFLALCFGPALILAAYEQHTEEIKRNLAAAQAAAIEAYQTRLAEEAAAAQAAHEAMIADAEAQAHWDSVIAEAQYVVQADTQQRAALAAQAVDHATVVINRQARRTLLQGRLDKLHLLHEEQRAMYHRLAQRAEYCGVHTLTHNPGKQPEQTIEGLAAASALEYQLLEGARRASKQAWDTLKRMEALGLKLRKELDSLRP